MVLKTTEEKLAVKDSAQGRTDVSAGLKNRTRKLEVTSRGRGSGTEGPPTNSSCGSGSALRPRARLPS